MRGFLGLLALAAILVHLILQGPRTLDRVAAGLLQGATGIRDETLEARRRVFGGTVDDIEAIKRIVPEQAEYMLAGDNRRGALYFIAYDLAPRRVRSVGSGWRCEEELLTLGMPTGAPQFVVIVPSSPASPYVVDTATFFKARKP